jgi:hypothetical protein
LDLKLATTLCTQLFWMRAADACQAALDIFRFELFFKLLQARLQVSLLRLPLSQLNAQVRGAVLSTLLRQY